MPFGAGGPTDVIARMVAQKVGEAWGQQVVTENLPGAGGNTGIAMAARAAPDGYTVMAVSTGFMVNPSCMPRSRMIRSGTSRRSRWWRRRPMSSRCIPR